MDTRAILGARPTGQGRILNVCAGYVSLNRPAPASFDDPAWVIIPSHSAQVPVPLSWPAIHGATMPAPGTPVTVAYDDQGTPQLISWAGLHS
jgi:hypothetical protein